MPGGIKQWEFSPDGRLVVAIDGPGAIGLWDALDGSALPAPADPDTWVTSLALGPDGSRIAYGLADRRAGHERGAANVGPPRRVVAERRRRVRSPASCSGRTAARCCCGPRTIASGCMTPAACGRSDRSPRRIQAAVAFSPDGRLILRGPTTGGCGSGTWRGDPVGPLIETPSDLITAGFEPDGRRIAVTTHGGLVGTWDIGNISAPSRFVRHRAAVLVVAFSPDGSRLATAGRDGTARIWRADDLGPAAPPLLHRGPLHYVVFHPDGARLAGSSNEAWVRIWDRDGRRSTPALSSPAWMVRLAFSPSGDRLLAGGIQGIARLWDLRTSRPIGPVLEEHPSHQPGHEVRWLAFGDGGRTAFTGSLDGSTIGWEAATGRRLPDAGLGRITSDWKVAGFAASADGRHVATVHEGWATLWDVAGARPRPTSRFPTGASHFSFSRDGRLLLATGKRGTSRVFSTDDGRPIGPPLLPDIDIWGSAFLADGRTLVLGLPPHRIRLFDLAAGRPIGPDLGHEALASLPEGRAAQGYLSARTAGSC